MNADEALEQVKQVRKQQKEYQQTLAELTGRENQILDDMESRFGVDNLSECKCLLDTMEKDIEQNTNRLNKMMEQLDEQAKTTS